MYRLKCVYGPDKGYYAAPASWTKCLDVATSYRRAAGFVRIQAQYNRGNLLLPELRPDIDNPILLNSHKVAIRSSINAALLANRFESRVDLPKVIRKHPYYTDVERRIIQFGITFSWHRWIRLCYAFRGTEYGVNDVR